MSPGVYSLEAFTFDGTNYYYDDSATTSLNDTQASNVNNGNAIQDYDVLVKVNNQYVLVDNCQHQLEYNDR